jgi:hypothetical protein
MKIKLLLLSIIALCYCNHLSSINRNSHKIEYSIYSAVIDSLMSRSMWSTQLNKSIIITCDSTIYAPFGDSLKRFDQFLSNEYPTIKVKSISDDFINRNKVSLKLIEKNFKTKIKVSITSKSSIFNLINYHGSGSQSDSLLKKSNGILFLSRIGFSKDKKYAILYYLHSAIHGGCENYILLKYDNNKWIIISILTEMYP